MDIQKRVLCVDDDEDDRWLICQAIQEVDPNLDIVQLENGVQALQFLKNAARTETLPCLVVLDINMPLLDGKETFHLIKEDSGLNRLNVVIFTSSENPNDKLFFKSRGAEMVAKPFDHQYLAPIVKNFLRVCAC